MESSEKGPNDSKGEWYQNILRKTFNFLNHINPFAIPGDIKNIRCKLNVVHATINADCSRLESLEEEIIYLRSKTDSYKSLLDTISDTVPDMLWAKDLSGRYMFANSKIREGLFYGKPENAVIGKTDIELAKECKHLVGDRNHTFGEVCGNSDEVIKKIKTSRRFLEYGLINGKVLYLEVHKAPLYSKDGTFIGTCGVGRDVTEFYLGLKSSIEIMEGCKNSKDKGCVNTLMKQLDRYKFEG